MPGIYVMIGTEPGETENLLKSIREKEEVVICEAVTGVCDIVVKLEGGSVVTLLNTVLQEIRKLPGIKSTETLVAVDM